MSTDPRSRGWVEVNPSALRRNLTRLRAQVGEGTGILPLVKADAYGIGIAQAVSILEQEAPWGYGVATVEEGMAVRRGGVTRPILVLSPAPQGSYHEGVMAGLTFCISSLEALQEISKVAEACNRDVTIHIEVDTGMGRSGFDWRRVSDWGEKVDGLMGERLHWEGIFTHFHSADRRDDPSCEEQVGRFREVISLLRGEGKREWILHLSNSAGALRGVGSGGGVVRPGIFLYGGVAGDGFPEPEEVVAVRARIVLIRKATAGTTLGYGAEYRASGEERWATVGIGYADGLPRALGNCGSGLVRGQRVPIVGRISMDLTVVDISHLPESVEVGEVVTFVGSDGEKRITLEEVAELAGTINYEILTGMSPRLPRVWVEEEGHAPHEAGIRAQQGKGTDG